MKQLFILFLFGLALSANGQRRQYSIGDSAFCGIVFFIQSDSSGRQIGLVCAPQDQGGQAPWFNGTYKNTFAIDDRIFDKGNADTIIMQQGNSGTYAALVCSVYLPAANCSAWYLPSKLELGYMYSNLALKGLGNFAREGYWTSLEDQPSAAPSSTGVQNRAWIVDFYNGNPISVDKSNYYHVRAVRLFNN
jgi:hypothetical protein